MYSSLYSSCCSCSCSSRWYTTQHNTTQHAANASHKRTPVRMPGKRELKRSKRRRWKAEGGRRPERERERERERESSFFPPAAAAAGRRKERRKTGEARRGEAGKSDNANANVGIEATPSRGEETRESHRTHSESLTHSLTRSRRIAGPTRRIGSDRMTVSLFFCPPAEAGVSEGVRE